MRRIPILLAALLCAASSHAQTYVRYDNILLNGQGRPLAGALVAVCTQPAVTTTTPCSPLAAIYSDNAGANQLNPTTTDGLGNYHFYIAPTTCGVGTAGCTIQFYGRNVVTSFKPDQSLAGGSGAFIAGCTSPGGVPYETAANTLGCGSLFTWDPVNLILQVLGASVQITSTTVSAPHFVSTNTSVAGYTDLPQGATAAADSICATANSICEQAPTSVTSYLVTKPGAGPTNNNSVRVNTAGSSPVESFALASVKTWLESAFTNATVTATTFLSFTLDASTTYAIHCHGVYKVAASGYFALLIAGPASPTRVTYDFNVGTAISSNAVTYLDFPGTGTATPVALNLTAVTTAATDMPWDLTIGYINGTTAGTLALEAFTVSTDTLTIEAGSYCTIQ